MYLEGNYPCACRTKRSGWSCVCPGNTAVYMRPTPAYRGKRVFSVGMAGGRTGRLPVRSGHGDVPLLDARAGGQAERFAGLFAGRHPVTVFLSAVVLGAILVAAGTIVFGLLLTQVILPVAGVDHLDGRLPVWLAAHRTGALTDASLVGSTIAGGVVVPALVGVVTVVLAVQHRWRIAAFVLFAIAVEAMGYRLTTLVVHRHRPYVVRLEHLPVNASFPSGHTAASIAVYVGLALLLTSRFRSAVVRVVCWAVTIVVPLFVGLSRMYRGMHHPLDVAGGLLLGIAALVVVLFAARAAGAAAERVEARRARS